MLSRSVGCTVILSTHIVSDLERIASVIGFMDKSKIVMSRPLDELKQEIVRIQIIFPGESVPEDFRLPEAIKMQKQGPVATGVVRLENEETLTRIRQIPGVKAQVFPMGLEDTFLEWFGNSADGNDSLPKERA